MLSDIIKEILPSISKFAPSLVNVLTMSSPNVMLVHALMLLANAFGVNMGQLHQLAATIENDPDHEQKLCNIENDFSDWFEEKTKGIKISDAELNLKVNFTSV